MERSLKENYLCVNVTYTKSAFFVMDKYIHLKKSYIILNLWPSSVFRQNIKTISLLLIFFTSCHTLCYISEFMPICEDWQFNIRWNARGRFRYLSIRSYFILDTGLILRSIELFIYIQIWK